MTHAELVALGAEWLRRQGCAVVITEMTSAAFETPDAIGFKGVGSISVECKASRSDFLRDSKKWFRSNPEYGMGRERYFLAPKGTIRPEELPAAWGLPETADGKVRKASGASPQDRHHWRESLLLLSALRRVGSAIPEGSGVSVKFYTYTSKGTATLGVEVEEAR